LAFAAAASAANAATAAAAAAAAERELVALQTLRIMSDTQINRGIAARIETAREAADSSVSLLPADDAMKAAPAASSAGTDAGTAVFAAFVAAVFAVQGCLVMLAAMQLNPTIGGQVQLDPS